MNLNYKLFILLPSEIINYIKIYIPLKQLHLTNKNNWIINYKNRINKRLKFTTRNTYIRYIIIFKLSFVLENYFNLFDKNQVEHWKSIIRWFRVYKYNKKKYKNYFNFLKWYARKNNSIKCLNLILAFENDIKTRKI